MKAACSLLLCSMLTLTACSAIEKSRRIDNPSTWSSSDPLSIPYEERLKQFEKGNLVANPSFEDGQILADDRATAFNLTAWENVGQNIDWIEQTADAADQKETNSGRHSIRITRRTATEMDAAQGVISEYIPLIPGNYDFTYNIRLKSVSNNKYRLGVQLYDAIVVKVLFFDANRQPVDAGYLNPVAGSLIDNSDKSYSFSNYWHIDDFPWGTVRARSYNYPFSEGDIPDKARFVRLFFGLKGTGTLWLDDVYFGYSKWNFTALERFSPYFDKELSLAEKINPTPKHVQYENDIAYYDAEDPPSQLPIIVLPENPDPAERSAAKILQDKISDIVEQAKPAHHRNGTKATILETDFSLNNIPDAALIISIGRNKLYEQWQPDFPAQSINNNQQGYVITAKQVGNRHVVYLIGATPIATYYAATTARQLFDNEGFVYHNATVVDYPDFLSRAYVFKNWENEIELRNDLNTIERMSLDKFNTAYFGYNRKNKAWHRPDALYRQGLAEAGRVLKEGGVMNLALMVNPYSHFSMEPSAESLDDQLRYTWTHSSSQSFDMLKDVCKIGLAAGAGTIMLLSDDFVPHTGPNPQHYGLYTDEDKKRFVNLQNAQADTINNLKKWLDRDYPGTRLEFCPPWYSNEHIDRSDGKAELYFQELAFQIPQDVAVIWTGPTIRSLSIDMADLYRYRSLIGRWPMIWDNTLYARNIESKRYGGYTTYYPGKVRMCNLFEPYDVYRPEDFYLYTDSRRMYINGSASSEVYKIKYATVADYAWNTAAYDPERSLWKVLCRTYGPLGAQKLIRFSDAYYQVYGICMRMEMDGSTDPYIEEGKERLTHLDHCLREVSQALPTSDPLLKELNNLRDKQRARFEKLSQGSTGTK